MRGGCDAAIRRPSKTPPMPSRLASPTPTYRGTSGERTGRMLRAHPIGSLGTLGALQHAKEQLCFQRQGALEAFRGGSLAEDTFEKGIRLDVETADSAHRAQSSSSATNRQLLKADLTRKLAGDHPNNPKVVDSLLSGYIAACADRLRQEEISVCNDVIDTCREYIKGLKSRNIPSAPSSLDRALSLARTHILSREPCGFAETLLGTLAEWTAMDPDVFLQLALDTPHREPGTGSAGDTPEESMWREKSRRMLHRKVGRQLTRSHLPAGMEQVLTFLEEPASNSQNAWPRRVALFHGPGVGPFVWPEERRPGSRPPRR